MANALVTYSRMIKLSHSLFALPFALGAALLAAREVEVSAGQLGLCLVCLVAARSSAMGFNRLVDRDVDAANPRTRNRELVTGEIGVQAAWGFTLLSAAIFVGASAALGGLTLALSPVVLAVVWGYSLTKRFTAMCHAVLGLALALAPTGVWVALTGSYSAVPLVLSLAVATWVAGFDLIYACQDAEFDRASGLHSGPARLGVAGALRLSEALHLATASLLAVLPALTPLGWGYAVGWVLISGVLLYEHRLVSPTDLSKVDKAFFDLNGYVSLLFLVFLGVGTYWV